MCTCRGRESVCARTVLCCAVLCCVAPRPTCCSRQLTRFSPSVLRRVILRVRHAPQSMSMADGVEQKAGDQISLMPRSVGRNSGSGRKRDDPHMLTPKESKPRQRQQSKSVKGKGKASEVGTRPPTAPLCVAKNVA